MMKTAMNNAMIVDNNLIENVMSAYIDAGGTYFDVEHIEGFIDEILASEIEYTNTEHFIEIVADHMMFEE